MNALTEREWELVAGIVTRPEVRAALIARAQLTPYFHLDGYMNRWWLFNPTPPKNDGADRQWPDLPSVRIHHILRSDRDRHPHDHPWNARSIILAGWYLEARDDGDYLRKPGDTFEINADTFHHIKEVSDGGVWTLFISGDWLHTWGYRTPEGKVPWRTYLGIPDGQEG